MLEENHNLEKIIEDAKQYRWYSVPDMYMVEILDTTGRSAVHFHRQKRSQ